MSLTRVWIPSGNYSGGGTKRLIVIHTTEGFTGPNGAADCAYYFQGDVGASSQVVTDNTHPGKIWECVSRNNGAWTQCNYNSAAVSIEQCGYASWSRDYWLNNQGNLLHNTAQWIAEESAKLGIPITDLSSSSAQGSGKGVCYHSELGSAGCGHSDPGSGYPLDKVLEWARGGTTSPPEKEAEDEMIAVYLAAGKGRIVTVAFTGAGKYNHLEACCDVGAIGASESVLRVAWHYGDEGYSGGNNLRMVPGNTKGVLTIPGNADGCSIRRETSEAMDLVISIDKY